MTTKSASDRPILVTGAGWYYLTDKITVTTGNAQQQQVTLPDHSIITLNANSSFTYYRAYGWHRRELWLKGEGLFDIRHGSDANAASCRSAGR